MNVTFYEMTVNLQVPCRMSNLTSYIYFNVTHQGQRLLMGGGGRDIALTNLLYRYTGELPGFIVPVVNHRIAI